MSPSDRCRMGGVPAVYACALGLMVLTGCREKPAEAPQPTAGEVGKKADRPTDASARPAIPSDAAAVEGVDARDDARAPACLPKSGEVGRWVKYEPVRVIDAGALAEVVTPEAAPRLAHFAVHSAARCAYSLDGDDGAEQRADVVLILADSAEDAYGLMTCQSSSTETVAVGGETRVERVDGLHFHCWQGRSYVHLWSAGSSAEAEAEMLKLLRYIAGHIPREDGPELLQAMPRDPENPGRRWFLRHLDSLSPDALGLSPAPDLAMNSRLLGLGPRTEMCIVSYDVPEARRPNVVWLVRYPTAAAATAAFARFAGYLPRAQAASWASTNLMRPHGPFLIGTWTVEEESLQYMMPRIRQLLPS